MLGRRGTSVVDGGAILILSQVVSHFTSITAVVIRARRTGYSARCAAAAGSIDDRCCTRSASRTTIIIITMIVVVDEFRRRYVLAFRTNSYDGRRYRYVVIFVAVSVARRRRRVRIVAIKAAFGAGHRTILDTVVSLIPIRAIFIAALASYSIIVRVLSVIIRLGRLIAAGTIVIEVFGRRYRASAGRTLARRFPIINSSAR